MGALTDVEIRNWVRAGRPIGRSDGGGLTFTLSESGVASWVLRYRHGGKAREKTLGRYPDLTLAEARKLAAEDRVKIQSGTDVALEKQKTKLEAAKAWTFSKLADDYFDKVRGRLPGQRMPVLFSLRQSVAHPAHLDNLAGLAVFLRRINTVNRRLVSDPGKSVPDVRRHIAQLVEEVVGLVKHLIPVRDDLLLNALVVLQFRQLVAVQFDNLVAVERIEKFPKRPSGVEYFLPGRDGGRGAGPGRGAGKANIRVSAVECAGVAGGGFDLGGEKYRYRILTQGRCFILKTVVGGCVMDDL